MLKLIHQFSKGVFKINKYDLAIIGAGPVGLFAANYAHLHNLNTIIFDSLNEVGGQPQMLYPFKNISDIPAFDSISAHDLINRLKKGISEKAHLVVNHRVKKVEANSSGFIIDDNIQVKTIIIATGNGAFKHKKFPVTISTAAKNKIHYSVKDPKEFKDQKIGIFGGGDSALDWAIELAKESRISLIHRRNEFRGLESSIEKLKKLKNVQILTPYLPKTAKITNDQLQIGLKKIGEKYLIQQKFDQIVVAYGFKADNQFVKNWGIELKTNKIKVSSTMETNIPGIYAIGDVVSYIGRVPIIGIGFGEAQIAITAIMRTLFPKKHLIFHSTNM